MHAPECVPMPTDRPHYSPSTTAWVGVRPCQSLPRLVPTLRVHSPDSQLQDLPAPRPARPDPGPELRYAEAHPEEGVPGPAPRGHLPG